MDLAQFLGVTVPNGNFLVVCFMRQGERNMGVRFFPRSDLRQAASWLIWAAGKKMDVWYAPASYRVSDGNPDIKKLRGSRTADNVQALRSFWVDLDIKRAGDNKKTNVYATFNEAASWLGDFMRNTGLPIPNLWVSSGYGLHLYWVLEDAIAPETWKPYAEALKAALLAEGAKADLGCTADLARILRPPETLNFKDPANPMPVKVIRNTGEYPNQLIYDKLQPYLSAVPTKAANYGSNSLVGGPPPILAAHQSSTTAAAQANLPTKRDYQLANIAKECGQVKQSLASGGAGDPYPLWYLGFMSLAHFCSDGEDWAHKLSQGDPRYTQAGVDAALQRVASEVAAKRTGAPTCSHFNACRPATCQACPHFGRITSPYTLGTDNGDLPADYRRRDGMIEQQVKGKEGETRWIKVIDGDVCAPSLDLVGSTYQLTFTYERAGRRFAVIVDKPMPTESGRIDAYFQPMGLTLPESATRPWREFIVAWINKLRDLRAERDQAVPPFGWAIKPDGNYGGFAVGGALYKEDGGEEAAPGGDHRIVAMYQPCGRLEEWQKAAELVTRGRPDLQVLVAAAFAAPLIEFTGQPGVLVSCWSQDSAVGKSSAFTIGTTVWARPGAMFSYKDTANSITYRIGKTRVMPSYWDEVPTDEQTSKGIIDLLFTIGQGKEKARLNSDSTLKESGDWKTVIVCSSNRPLMDHVEHLRNDTDAGALRLFEFPITHPQMPLDPMVATIISATEKNAGNAGRLYAAWLAKNSATAKGLVEGFGRKLKDTLQPFNGERFYIAGMSALMAGASIASMIQVDGKPLVDFDRNKMWAFLIDAFLELRSRRAKNLPVSSGMVDLDKIFGKFVSDNMPDALITARFKRRGPPAKTGASVKVIWVPRKQFGRLAIHIAAMDQLMRVDRDVWDMWCRKHNYSASDLLHQMIARWGVTEARGVIGAGTHYQSGRVAYFELPLSHPELTEYYDCSNLPGLASGTAPALAGGAA